MGWSAPSAEQKLFPVLCGAPARNIAVSPLLDLVGGGVSLPPGAARRRKATDPKGTGASGARRRTRRRWRPWSSRPIADPFAGKVTMFRVYSGTHHLGLHRAERHQGRQGADRATAPPARQAADAGGGPGGRRHRGGGQAQGDADRRYAVRREDAHPLAGDHASPRPSSPSPWSRRPRGTRTR